MKIVPLKGTIKDLDAGVTDLTPIKIASFKSEYQRFCGSDICSNRYVMNVTESEKIHTVNICCLGVDRITEEKED